MNTEITTPTADLTVSAPKGQLTTDMVQALLEAAALLDKAGLEVNAKMVTPD